MTDASRLRILFVCYGNICRSPMAVGIARTLFGARVEADGCGVGAVRGTPPTPEASLAVKALFKADISTHRSKPVEDVALGDYDVLVAMDFPVYGRLRRREGVLEDKVRVWDIEDPLGLGYEAYRQTARKIRERLEQLLESERG